VFFLSHLLLKQPHDALLSGYSTSVAIPFLQHHFRAHAYKSKISSTQSQQRRSGPSRALALFPAEDAGPLLAGGMECDGCGIIRRRSAFMICLKEQVRKTLEQIGGEYEEQSLS